MDKSTTVLIADNSEEFSASLVSAIQRAGGFQVLGTANDGEQALHLITERKPDILVLDLMLAKRTVSVFLRQWLPSRSGLWWWQPQVLLRNLWHRQPPIWGCGI